MILGKFMKILINKKIQVIKWPINWTKPKDDDGNFD